MNERPQMNIGHLDTYGFGSRSPMYWGTLAFIVLEGTGFALTIGTYLYLMTINRDWPIGAPPPDLPPATLLTLVMVLSAVPNYFLKEWARRERRGAIRIGLLVMTATGAVLLIIRAYEFPVLNVSWDSNAYGSIVWFLLGLHTTHLLTDVGDTAVLTVLMFTRHANSGRRYSDVEENAVYWDFVVLSWLPIYVLIYWVPRW
jgi:heme/copper-type cytochrome/quinol oxidase subunit 3